MERWYVILSYRLTDGGQPSKTVEHDGLGTQKQSEIMEHNGNPQPFHSIHGDRCLGNHQKLTWCMVE